jgi:phage gp36-like protein
MGYASVEEFQDRFGLTETIELSNLENPLAETPNYQSITYAIAQAESEIDSYLGARYEVPIQPPLPLVLISHCLTLARYNLDRYRRREDVREDYKLVIAQLQQMALGKMALVRPDSRLVPPKGFSRDKAFGDVSFHSPDPIWTRDKLRNYQRFPRRWI